jgi:hypothetical protein
MVKFYKTQRLIWKWNDIRYLDTEKTGPILEAGSALFAGRIRLAYFPPF